MGRVGLFPARKGLEALVETVDCFSILKRNKLITIRKVNQNRESEKIEWKGIETKSENEGEKDPTKRTGYKRKEKDKGAKILLISER